MGPEQKVEENAGSLFTLTSRLEMDQEECQKWVTEYEADPRLRTVLAALRQGQRVTDYQTWARRVFGVTGTGTGSVPVPVPVPEFPFQGPLLPFQNPFFVRSSFRSGPRSLFFWNGFGTDPFQFLLLPF